MRKGWFSSGERASAALLCSGETADLRGVPHGAPLFLPSPPSHQESFKTLSIEALLKMLTKYYFLLFSNHKSMVFWYKFLQLVTKSKLYGITTQLA